MEGALFLLLWLAAVPVAAMFTLVAGATLESFVVFVCPMTRRRAVWAEMFNGLVVAPTGVSDAVVAILPSVGLGGYDAGEEQKATESHCRGYSLTEE